MSCDDKCGKAKLCPFSLGIALGFTNAICLTTMAFGAAYWGYGSAFMDMMASIYPGYGASFWGALKGAGWGFLDGFITGAVFAFIYDFCMCCCCRRKKEE